MSRCCLFQAGLNGHLYKMPEIPESFPELCDMKYSILKHPDFCLRYEHCFLPKILRCFSFLLPPAVRLPLDGTFCYTCSQSDPVVKAV